MAELYTNSPGFSGNLLIRLPVAAKIALVNAGAVGGSAGSPMPVGSKVLGTM
jgi:hypothetical protein